MYFSGAQCVLFQTVNEVCSYYNKLWMHVPVDNINDIIITTLFHIVIIAGNKALHDTASDTKALITETKSQTENSPGSWNE